MIAIICSAKLHLVCPMDYDQRSNQKERYHCHSPLVNLVSRRQSIVIRRFRVVRAAGSIRLHCIIFFCTTLILVFDLAYTLRRQFHNFSPSKCSSSPKTHRSNKFCGPFPTIPSILIPRAKEKTKASANRQFISGSLQISDFRRSRAGLPIFT